MSNSILTPAEYEIALHQGFEYTIGPCPTIMALALAVFVPRIISASHIVRAHPAIEWVKNEKSI